MSDLLNQGYEDLLHQSPYLVPSSNRVKDNFVFIASLIENKKNISSLVDIGCANGEFLSYLKENGWRGSYLTGVDLCQEYIDCAKLHSNLHDAKLICDSFFQLDRKWDLVVSIGTIHGFSNVEEVLDKLLLLCNPGGLIIIEGLINDDPIEIQCRMCDNSNPSTAGKWISCLNRFSKKRLTDYLDGKCAAVDFYSIPMKTFLEKIPGFPRSAYTIRTETGELLITKWGQLLNSAAVVIKKH